MRIESQYFKALELFVEDAQASEGSDVVYVVVLFRNGRVDAHHSKEPGWPLLDRIALFWNLLVTAARAPFQVPSNRS